LACTATGTGKDEAMEMVWKIAPILGIVIGGLIMLFGFRKKNQKSAVFSDIDGVLKQDWTRTGNIDFYAAECEMTSPQFLALRVEEKKITENAMGQDIVQLRWRLATLEEAKEVVSHWNAGKSDRNSDVHGLLLKSA
jgi:hypothetical protein